MIVNKISKDAISIIDMRDTMYPSYSLATSKNCFIDKKDIGWSTMFGFSTGKSTIKIENLCLEIFPNQFFSIPIKNKDVELNVSFGVTFVVFRLGFLGHDIIGNLDTTKSGKLSYIDGCSDSLLVYPPRFGDASMNYLYFPSNITQSYHTHPSIRIGYVIDGFGFSDTDQTIPLEKNVFFCLEEHELHRFKTDNSFMKIVVYHPDGEWGPTDENHTMLNRTYIKK